MELRRRGVVLDVDRYAAMRDGRLLPLTAAQFALLEALMAANGEPVPVHVLHEALQQVVGERDTSLRGILAGLTEVLGPPALITIDGEMYTLL